MRRMRGGFVTSRIPFDFTLMDARHRSFAEGRRDTMLSLFQVIAARNVPAVVGCVLVGGLLLFWGGRSLIYDWSVEWRTAEALITQVSPVPSVQNSSRFNWWYFYRFTTDAGEGAMGKIVLDKPGWYLVGDKIQVLYARSDPGDNRHAGEWLPRGYRDWFFVAMSAFLLGSAALGLRGGLAEYRALRRIARAGQPIPGEVVMAQLDQARIKELLVAIDYIFATPEGRPVQARAEIPLARLVPKILPKPGTRVAVWHAPNLGGLLL